MVQHQIKSPPATEPMYIDLVPADKVTIINISIGKVLDLRLCNTFLNVCEYATSMIPSRIVVDLSETEQVYDSGLAMLLLLNEHSSLLSGKIEIRNCKPDIYQQLKTHILPKTTSITINDNNILSMIPRFE